MPTLLQVQITEADRVVFEDAFDGPVEMGRQREGEEGPYARKKADGNAWRLVIARIVENRIGRQQLRVEALPDGQVNLVNLSAAAPVFLDGGRTLAPSGQLAVPAPVLVQFGPKALRFDVSGAAGAPVTGLAEATMVPGKVPQGSARLTRAALSSLDSNREVERLIKGLQITTDVLQSANTQAGLYKRIAEAVVDMVGLDAGRILMFQPEDRTWKLQSTATSALQEQAPLSAPSRSVLNQLLAEKRTLWQSAQINAAEVQSLQGIDAVVAAPILSPLGEVLGAIYGDRRMSIRTMSGGEISRTEAMLVELLACGLASALARIKQEQLTHQAQTQFEMFFGKDLAGELNRHPDMLTGRDAEITVLFADIRRFSRISQDLPADQVFELINDVMEELSKAVVESEGVPVDYIGDEIIAMWGAPQSQPDHAIRACRAALDMARRLPAISARWLSLIGHPIDIGIGINTGRVRVGNSGSKLKFKYGPLGHAVNLASRVQGATKYFRTRSLITQSTYEQLRGEFPCRRLCDVKVVNIEHPVSLYELTSPGAPTGLDLRTQYEHALLEFQKRSFRQAHAILANLLLQHPDDGPTLLLLSRTASCILAEDPDAFDPVWELPGK